MIEATSVTLAHLIILLTMASSSLGMISDGHPVPSVRVPSEGPPQLADGVVCEVPPDGFCLYQCFVAAVNAKAFMDGRNPNGANGWSVPIGPQQRHCNKHPGCQLGKAAALVGVV